MLAYSTASSSRQQDVLSSPNPDTVSAQVAGYLWGLPGYDSLQHVDWAKASPASLSAWLTIENVLQSHPNRVLRSSSATTALLVPAWWQQLPAALVDLIDRARSKWPLKATVWEQAGFVADPDWPFLRKILIDGAPMCPVDAIPAKFNLDNCRSFELESDAAQDVILEELKAGYLAPLPPGCTAGWVHPLGVVPKKSGAIRIIHDLSAPHGASVNDSQFYWYRKFSLSDDFAAMLTPDCYIGRLDVKAYYRNFGVNPLFWPLQSFSVDGQVYYDSRLQFGMRSSPEIADRFSSALVRDAIKHGVEKCMAVVDDFTVVHDRLAKCTRDWSWLCSRLKELGFELSYGIGKTDPPEQIATVLGLVYNTVAWTVALDDAKVLKLATSVCTVAGSTKVFKRDLDKLCGFLLWASRVIFAGRSFCHHLLAAARSVKKQHHRVYLNRACRRELAWWASTAPSLNGSFPILPAAPHLWRDFQVDASTTGGPGATPCIGVWIDGAYVSLCHGQLSRLYTDVPALDAHINTWELYAVLICVRLFCDYMAGGHWRVRTDSSSVEGWLMKGDCRDDLRHSYLSEMATCGVSKYFRLTAKHIPGAQNCMADALSRCRFDEVALLLSKWKASRLGSWVE